MSIAKMSRIFVASADKGLAIAVQRLLPSENVVGIHRSESGISSDDRSTLVNDAEVLLADVPVILDVVHNVKKLKWAASTWAGVENLVKGLDPHKPPSCVITRMGEAFNKLMAEYVLGYMLTKERSIVEVAQEQCNKTWSNEKFKKNGYRSLSQLTIGILGVGEIGSEVARLCSCMGMTVIGMTRSVPPEDRRCPGVTTYRTTDELSDVLHQSDYVCNILPSTPETRGLLSGEAFSHCKHKKSVFINIGRGDITDESSILKAIREGWLSGAVLDVFPTEPLPSDSPLWTEPGVLITPHIAGVSLTNMVAEGFVHNYKLYRENKPLKYQLDVQRGY